MTVKETAREMKLQSPFMAASRHETRLAALSAIRDAIVSNKDAIFEANARDLAAAEEQGISEAVIKRLKFDEGKLKSVTEGIDILVGLADPVGEVTLKRQMSEGLVMERVSTPIGVIGVIFEARPDALVQIAALCIKSGNMCILKGGKETENTNKALFDVILKAAVDTGLPDKCLARVSKHNEISELLTCEGSVDLIIPRGSNEFVKYIMDSTTIPVLGHADGICHMYIDGQADVDLAVRVAFDAKTQYPAACNAVETLLVSEKIASEFLPQMKKKYDAYGVKMYGTAAVNKIIPVDVISDDDFKREYLDLAVSVKLVADVKEAVEHINAFGSHHTDSIVTKDDGAWDYFSALVDSAGVYRNISTRFADGFRYGFGAEVGISTSKIHARGPVGLAGLMTYKYRICGDGHIVGDFESGKAKFEFKDIR